jgi:hypothetical protein
MTRYLAPETAKNGLDPQFPCAIGLTGPKFPSVRSIWHRFALAALMGAVAFLVTLLVPSIAHAASAAPLCDFRGASVVVRVPDPTASVDVTTTDTPISNVAALCDTRGATMIAPAPQLQSEPTFLTLTPGADALSALMEHSVVPGQHELAFEMQLPDPSMIAVVPAVAPATEIGRVACPVVENLAHDGVRTSLERPPRA